MTCVKAGPGVLPFLIMFLHLCTSCPLKTWDMPQTNKLNLYKYGKEYYRTKNMIKT